MIDFSCQFQQFNSQCLKHVKFGFGHTILGWKYYGAKRTKSKEIWLKENQIETKSQPKR